jgi:hypothetical protein
LKGRLAVGKQRAVLPIVLQLLGKDDAHSHQQGQTDQRRHPLHGGLS